MAWPRTRPSWRTSWRPTLGRAGLRDEVKDWLSAPGTSLSGGRQQRLCIARAIAVSPEVILTDEPCSALNPTATGIIEDLIGELQQSSTTAIDLAFVAKAIERVGNHAKSIAEGVIDIV